MDLARAERAVKSCGNASSICVSCLSDATKACEIRLERTEEVRSGRGSSGLDVGLSNGKNGL